MPFGFYVFWWIFLFLNQYWDAILICLLRFSRLCFSEFSSAFCDCSRLCFLEFFLLFLFFMCVFVWECVCVFICFSLSYIVDLWFLIINFVSYCLLLNYDVSNCGFYYHLFGFLFTNEKPWNFKFLVWYDSIVVGL